MNYSEEERKIIDRFLSLKAKKEEENIEEEKKEGENIEKEEEKKEEGIYFSYKNFTDKEFCEFTEKNIMGQILFYGYLWVPKNDKIYIDKFLMNNLNEKNYNVILCDNGYKYTFENTKNERILSLLYEYIIKNNKLKNQKIEKDIRYIKNYVKEYNFLCCYKERTNLYIEYLENYFHLTNNKDFICYTSQEVCDYIYLINDNILYLFQ